MRLDPAATFPCGHDRPALCVSWGVGGAVASGGGDNSVRLFFETPGGDGGVWRQIGAAESAHEDEVNGVAWHPTERGVLASCSDDGTAKIWRVTPRARAEG